MNTSPRIAFRLIVNASSEEVYKYKFLLIITLFKTINDLSLIIILISKDISELIRFYISRFFVRYRITSARCYRY